MNSNYASAGTNASKRDEDLFDVNYDSQKSTGRSR